ncbi:MAG TPA: hypothetical protein VNI01_04010 [Elusimicrobiota bacterium]|nr:hypothetical protein [Elusimicrobiota bacterium]
MPRFALLLAAGLLASACSPASACMELANFNKLFRGSGSSDAPAEEKGAVGGVVLFDGSGGYDTGECVQVFASGSRDGVSSVLVASEKGERVWVPASSVYAFKGLLRYPYEPFFREEDLPAATIGEKAQLRELGSRAFLDRALRNGHPRVRSYAAQRLINLLPDRELAAAWGRLQEDPDRDVRYSASQALIARFERVDPPNDPALDAALAERLLGGDCSQQSTRLVALSFSPGKYVVLGGAARAGCMDALWELRGRSAPAASAAMLELARSRSADAQARTRALLYLPDEPLGDEDIAFLRERYRAGPGEDRRDLAERLMRAWPDPAVHAWAKETLAAPDSWGVLIVEGAAERLSSMTEPGRFRWEAAELFEAALRRTPAVHPRYERWRCPPDTSAPKTSSYADQLMLEAIANAGGDEAFAEALACLDGIPREFKGYDWDIVLRWLEPWSDERLAAVRDPARREELAKRLRALRAGPVTAPLRAITGSQLANGSPP